MWFSGVIRYRTDAVSKALIFDLYLFIFLSFWGKCALLISSEFYCSWVFYRQNKNKMERRMKWERIGVSTALTLGRTENVTIAVSFTNSLLQLATINGKNSSECPSDSCRVITVQSSNSMLTKSDTQQSVTLMCLRFRDGKHFFNDWGCFPESKRKDSEMRNMGNKGLICTELRLMLIVHVVNHRVL